MALPPSPPGAGSSISFFGMQRLDSPLAGDEQRFVLCVGKRGQPSQIAHVRYGWVGGWSPLFDRDQKSQCTYCVFNEDRESFLSLNVKTAHSCLLRLKKLFGRNPAEFNEGIWFFQSHGVCTIGLWFAIDVIYLNAENRVIHLIESLKTFRLSTHLESCASVLELPVRTIHSSQTGVGDRLLICSQSEMEDYFRKRQCECEAR
ncbi:MAG: DUF192 domain-containing protein [Acidobacteriaceae bacterium]|nr:DUF192 domain-containing protein [Acidobacteriaceae bacterium]